MNIAQWLAAIACVLPVTIQAQTLGDELLLSRLGDPVEVEINVEDWQDFDLSQVSVSNGSPEQYELFGLDYQPILDELNFALIGPNLAGEVKVLISSRDPVSEPFLELLLVLSWSSGSTLRDYTLLFDPPLPPAAPSQTPPPQVTTVTTVPAGTTPAEAVAVAPPANRQLRVVTLSPPSPPQPLPSPETASTQPPPLQPQPATLPSPPAALPAPPPSPSGRPDVRTQVAVDIDDVADASVAAPVPTADALNVERRSYTVRNNDTLWVIARQFQPAGDTENLYQFLVSLHDLNRNAFINGNISMLRSGAELLIPTARDVSSINPGTAQVLFEELWADGTHVSNGAASVPPPEFSSLEQTVEEAPVAEPEKPARIPGTELPDTDEGTALLPSANAEVVAIGIAPGIESNEPIDALVDINAALPQPEDLLEEATASIAAPQSPLGMSDNPYLQQVVDSAQKIEQILQVREQRMVRVEEQLLEMQVQLQQAQIAALELNAKVQEAALLREQQKSADLRTTAFLGTLVTGLLLALAFALKQMVALHRQLRELAQVKLANLPRRQAVVMQEPGFFTSEQVEVVELEDILSSQPAASPANQDLVRDMDKVPDIELSSSDVDFLVVDPPSTVEDSDKAPRSLV